METAVAVALPWGRPAVAVATGTGLAVGGTSGVGGTRVAVGVIVGVAEANTSLRSSIITGPFPFCSVGVLVGLGVPKTKMPFSTAIEVAVGIGLVVAEAASVATGAAVVIAVAVALTPTYTPGVVPDRRVDVGSVAVDGLGFGGALSRCAARIRSPLSMGVNGLGILEQATMVRLSTSRSVTRALPWFGAAYCRGKLLSTQLNLGNLNPISPRKSFWV